MFLVYLLRQIGWPSWVTILDKEDVDINTKRATCLTLLPLSLISNGLKLLEDLEATPLELVSDIIKVPFCGCYLTLSMVEVLISMKNYHRLACAEPAPPPRGRYA